MDKQSLGVHTGTQISLLLNLSIQRKKGESNEPILLGQTYTVHCTHAQENTHFFILVAYQFRKRFEITVYDTMAYGCSLTSNVQLYGTNGSINRL